MRSRPWPIKILFICHLLAPALNLVIGAWLTKVPVRDFVIFKFYNSSHLEIFATLALVPIGGVVIFICKKWSYYLYLALMLSVFTFNFFRWWADPKLYSLTSLIGFFLINTVVVGYFLIPAVRVVYFNRRLRWWESEPRYVVGLEGQITNDKENESIDCQILNISQNGARLKGDLPLKIDDQIQIGFTYEGESFKINGCVLNQREDEFGIQFTHSNESKRQIKAVIRKSFSKDYRPRTEDDPLIASFFDWLAKLIRTGKGLVPDTNKKS